MTETQNVEWKRMWKDEYLAWICGFANAQGGKLDLGKNDNGQIVGLKNSKKLLEDIPNKIRDAMGIIVNINLHSVYEDRLYIANCGRLPENWTLEKLMGKHASAPFNPNIANVFYLAGFIESWGRGVEKICSACKEDGIPQPEYAIEPNDIMLKFTVPEDRIIHRVTERVTEGEKTIVALLVEDPSYTYKELSEKSGMSRKTVAEKIKSLKEKSIIKRIGSDKKGYWEIKVVNE